MEQFRCRLFVAVLLFASLCQRCVQVSAVPYESAAKPCCLGPKTDGEKHPEAGKTPDVKPAHAILGDVFFPCEIVQEKTEDELCKAAAERFTEPLSSLYPVKKFIYMGEETKKSKPHATPKKHLLLPPDFINHKWTSDRSADVAVVSKGCCHNVYLDLKPGQEVSSNCENIFIGEPNELSNLFGYSAVTAGDASFRQPQKRDPLPPGSGTTVPPAGPREPQGGPPVQGSAEDTEEGSAEDTEEGSAEEKPAVGRMLQNASADTPFSVLIGGDYKSIDPYTFAGLRASSPAAALPGLLGSTGLFIGNFIPSGGDLVVVMGEAVVSQSSTRVKPNISLIDQAAVNSVRTAISARVCAVSKEIAGMGATGNFRYTGEGSSRHTDLYCPRATPGSMVPCVIHMTGEQASMVSQGTVNVVGGIPLTVKINVWGGRSVQLNPYELDAVLRDKTQIVWNFPESDSVVVSLSEANRTVFYGAIVAPVASQVLVREVIMGGTIAMAKFESHLTVSGSFVPPDQPIVACPNPQESITFCNCLCGDHEAHSHGNH